MAAINKIYNEDFFYRNILKHSKEMVMKEISKKNEAYEQYEIDKKNGTRTISALKKDTTLHELQKNLNQFLFSNQPLPVCVKGFVRGIGYFDFLYEHVSTHTPIYYMRLDIKDFFDSIKEDSVASYLKDFIKIGDVVNAVTEICTLDGKLPQGAITSPMLSNIVLRRIDQRITLYCQSIGVTYSRYADDLLFSSHEINFKEMKWFQNKIKHILKSIKLKINYRKIRYGKDRIVLNGYVVEENVNLSRERLKRLTSILYYFNKSKNDYGKRYRIDNDLFSSASWLSELNSFLESSTDTKLYFANVNQLHDFLCGYRAYLISSSNYSSPEKKEQYSKKIDYIRDLVEKISQ